MFNPSDIDAPDIFGDLGSDAMKVVGPLARPLFAPACSFAAFGGLPEAIETSAAPAAVAGIPPEHLVVMQQVSNQTGIPWQIFAAISKMESGFGSNMGPSSAGALGYCQFMPGTWAGYDVDGDGDGIADPYNYRDCIPAMGRYLMASGAPADMHRALFAYNHLWSYVETVLAIAANYGYLDPASIPARAVELAWSKVGAPYVWGAEGPDAFDCKRPRALGLRPARPANAPRTAQQQFDWATPIDPSQLQPGDLTFYEEHLPIVGSHHTRWRLRRQRNGGDVDDDRRLRPRGRDVRPLLVRPLRQCGASAVRGGLSVIGNRGAMAALVGMAGLLLVMAVVSGWARDAPPHKPRRRQSGGRGSGRRVRRGVRHLRLRDPESYQQRLLSLTTGQVREAVLTRSVDPADLARQQTMTASVVSVEVTAHFDDEATVSVTAEQLRRIVDTTSGRLVDERVTQTADCRLVKEAGGWRVAEFHLRSEEPQTNPTAR